jgi:hypothetical protein
MAKQNEPLTPSPLDGLEGSDLKTLIAFLAEERIAKAEQRNKEQKERETLARNVAENARQQMEVTAYKQQMCRHQKDDNRTAVHGQPTSDGLQTLICVKCHKLWKDWVDEDGKPLPDHLVPSERAMGLPSAY